MCVTQFDTGLLSPKPDNVPVSPTNPLPVTGSFSFGAASLAATIVEFYKAPAAIATPEPLMAASTLVATVTLYAQRAGRGNANVGSVWWGWSGTNDSQYKELLPGDQIVISAPPGKLIDLNQLYIDAVTLTDGVHGVCMV